MPHRRKRRKGSFGGHFDELVKHFPHDQREKSRDQKSAHSNDERSVHDRLFERSWSPKEERRPPS